jgi:hypothetical protein
VWIGLAFEGYYIVSTRRVRRRRRRRRRRGGVVWVYRGFELLVQSSWWRRDESAQVEDSREEKGVEKYWIEVSGDIINVFNKSTLK